MNGQVRLGAAMMIVGSIAVAGILAAVGSSTTAAAQPLPPLPTDPAAPALPPVPPGPPLPIIGAPLVRDASLLPGLPTDLNQYLLGQNPVPLAPGGPPGVPPNLLGLNNSTFLPQNLTPSAPGEGAMFDVAPGDEHAALSGIDLPRRVWHLYEGGYLRGGLLGQIPVDQLGTPLPGTAPPSGTAIPPGLTPHVPEVPLPLP